MGIIKSLLVMQLVMTTAIALVLFLCNGNRSAISAVLGGIVAILPSALFARKLFQYQGARAARKIVRSFYFGEALKLLLSMALFTLVFVFYEVKPLAFFVTYIVVVISIWFAPLFFANKHNRPKSD